MCHILELAVAVAMGLQHLVQVTQLCFFFGVLVWVYLGRFKFVWGKIQRLIFLKGFRNVCLVFFGGLREVYLN